MGLLLGIILLIACQVYLEKKGLPVQLEAMKLRYFLLLTIGLISLAMLVGKELVIGPAMVGLLTIVCSTVIAYKYRKKFEKMERGEQV